MRLSRLLIAVAATFSASAFAVMPPETRGPQQDESMSPQAAMPSQSEREDNAWLSTTPSDAWQSSSQSESERSQQSGQAAMTSEEPESDADRSSIPQQVPERVPSVGEQS